MELTVKVFHRRQAYWFDIMGRSKEVIDDDFDENTRKSLALVKILFVLTVETLKEAQLQMLNEIKPNQVKVINLALQSKTKSIKNPAPVKRRTFTYDDVETCVKALKTKYSKQVCN